MKIPKIHKIQYGEQVPEVGTISPDLRDTIILVQLEENNSNYVAMLYADGNGKIVALKDQYEKDTVLTFGGIEVDPTITPNATGDLGFNKNVVGKLNENGKVVFGLNDNDIIRTVYLKPANIKGYKPIVHYNNNEPINMSMSYSGNVALISLNFYALRDSENTDHDSPIDKIICEIPENLHIEPALRFVFDMDVKSIKGDASNSWRCEDSDGNIIYDKEHYNDPGNTWKPLDESGKLYDNAKEFGTKSKTLWWENTNEWGFRNINITKGRYIHMLEPFKKGDRFDITFTAFIKTIKN